MAKIPKRSPSTLAEFKTNILTLRTKLEQIEYLAVTIGEVSVLTQNLQIQKIPTTLKPFHGSLITYTKTLQMVTTTSQHM